ncbi:hypothetical protein GCM10025870_33910 [Agromyces marinus]|uniref:Uncharacterized protein n=1 Tax=Agromyces marinus TaxID=1389020 RepID=A0ABM8H653_9MICO|nr:hypothetical protein [Agromyces marinus]BDZ52946.1 hypothetical protein GCM10025870_00190 [Agromyces marinus]BDZ56318.1 hypothetical protein GCM10025870_33910 [Agromyces marinus]
MADVMIAVMPFVGHVAPLAAVAAAFRDDGHSVRVYTGSAHADRFAALGADVVPWTRAPDFDENDLAATFPELRGRKGPRQMLANVRELFIGTGAAQGDDLVAAHRERPWDVIVADGLSLGAHLAAERTGTPWVTVSIVPLAIRTPELPPPSLGLRPARGPLGRARDRTLHAVLGIATRSMQQTYDAQRAASGLGVGTPFENAFYSPTSSARPACRNWSTRGPAGPCPSNSWERSRRRAGSAPATRPSGGPTCPRIARSCTSRRAP